MKKYIHKCEMCGKEFENYCKTTRFCDRTCYDKYRQEHGKLKEVECPVCGRQFKQAYSKQIFCSVECRTKSTENRVECVCEHCGKVFFRKHSEVDKHNHHYCSIECRNKSMWWSDEDTRILQENFGKLSYKEMVGIFTTNKTVDEIKRRAVYVGLTSSKKWSKEEIKLLVQNYSTIPMSKVA